LLETELAHRLQHAEARIGQAIGPALFHSDETVVVERAEAVNDRDGGRARRIGDRLCCLERRASDEDGETAKQRLLRRVEEVVTPADGRPQRLLPLRPIAPAAGEEPQAIVKTRQDRLGRQQADARRRQLDGQREPVQLVADLRHHRHVVVREPEPGHHVACPREKEADRGKARQTVYADLPEPVGCSERRHGQHGLLGDAEGLPARGEDA